MNARILSMLLLAGLAACAKADPEQIENPVPESKYILHFKAAVPESKSSMDEYGKMTWQPTDTVKFFDGTTAVSASPENINGGTAEFTVIGLDPDAARYYAAYPADMVNNFESNGNIVFKSYGPQVQEPDSSYCAVAACPKSDNMTLTFRNVSYILRVQRPATGAGSDAVAVTFMTLDNVPLSSGVTVALASGTNPEIASVTPGSNTCFTASAKFDNEGVAILNLDPITASNGFVLVAVDNTSRAMGIQIYKKSHTFNSGSFYPWPLELQVDPERPDPEPPIGGLTLARGNLYYHNGEWGIENRAYDFRTWVGKPCCIDGVYSEEATGTVENDNIGLFYWTPDPDKSRAKDYVGTWTATTASNNDFFANNMSIGGKTWRGITKAEMEYIGAGRTNATALRARATITGTGLAQGITGVIFLPDNFGSNPGFTLNAAGQWIFPYGGFVLETDMSKPAGGFSDNLFTIYQWSILQYLGCAFFPAAGRAGSEHIYIGDSLGQLYYWSAYYYNQSGSTHRACYFYGKEFQAGDESYGDCQQGFAVRLVKK